MTDSTDSRTIASWQDAELLAAAHMRSMGFADAVVTAPGADGGVDVIDPGAGAAQVKHYSATPVGAPDVQKIRGAGHDTTHALFYSFSGYTRQALSYAEIAAIALFSYTAAGVVTPASSAAIKLLNDGYRPVRFGDQTQARQLLLASLAKYAQQVADTVTALLEALFARSRAMDHTAVDRAGLGELERVLVAAQAANEIIQRLNSGRLVVGKTVEELAQAEAHGQSIAEFLGVSYASVESEAAVKRADSGFVATATQV